MGEHSSGIKSWGAKLVDGGKWAWAHRRKIASAIVVALPFASRYVPDFPSAEIMAILRAFLGA
jgi:hypothetical protein